MSVEHKRPLYAFVVLAVVCGLFLGHALRSEALVGVLRTVVAAAPAAPSPDVAVREPERAPAPVVEAPAEPAAPAVARLAGTTRTSVAPRDVAQRAGRAAERDRSSRSPDTTTAVDTDVTVPTPPVDTPPVTAPPVVAPPVVTPPVATPPVGVPPSDDAKRFDRARPRTSDRSTVQDWVTDRSEETVEKAHQDWERAARTVERAAREAERAADRVARDIARSAEKARESAVDDPRSTLPIPDPVGDLTGNGNGNGHGQGHGHGHGHGTDKDDVTLPWGP